VSEYWTVADTARKITAGEITAYRLVENVLGRIQSVDRELGAFLAVDSNGARDAASEVERRRMDGEPLGALAGVPIALKDNLVTKGTVTTAGGYRFTIVEMDGPRIMKVRAEPEPPGQPGS
jgi:aspartyl-tRNA(Asn)/glutamyl-tRNA(Gln) amidotransferase subunit A